MPNPLGQWPVTCVPMPVAWGDMDAFGHVNNTKYLRWFEDARIAYFAELGILTEMRKRGIGPILARATVDFKIPVAFPDTITASSTIVKLGRTSFVMNYLVTSRQHDDAVAAEGEGIIVLFDYEKKEKVELPEVLRSRIAELESRS